MGRCAQIFSGVRTGATRNRLDGPRDRTRRRRSPGPRRTSTKHNCRNCGARGHWARECRITGERRTAPASGRNPGGSVSIVTAGWNGVNVYLALKLHGRGVYGLLDTGCDTSVISRRVIPNEPLKPTIPLLRNCSRRTDQRSICWWKQSSR